MPLFTTFLIIHTLWSVVNKFWVKNSNITLFLCISLLKSLFLLISRLLFQKNRQSANIVRFCVFAPRFIFFFALSASSFFVFRRLFTNLQACFYSSVFEFYENEENIKAFEEWKKYKES